MRRRGGSARGVTLVETMIALGIFAFGLAALFGMIGHVQSANRSMSFQNRSIEIFARVAAQIRDAQCDVPAENAAQNLDALATMDPGLRPTGGEWVRRQVTGSSIAFVGDAADLPELQSVVPPLRVDYRVAVDGTPGAEVPALDVDVRIREITRDAARDADSVLDGYWVRTFPVKKICNPRLDATRRGEYR